MRIELRPFGVTSGRQTTLPADVALSSLRNDAVFLDLYSSVDSADGLDFRVDAPGVQGIGGRLPEYAMCSSAAERSAGSLMATILG
ncbi:unnamed protein product [Heligmosomoides polygyrus]|uniref:Kinesin motor domain-containing protein n=1 Tax=Heligmosomoides polygyrus TaxID=6339 RepID=A0A183FIK7_HELPZ|nr:unnamed protein product [Heligmosomoides polygyrus]